MKEASGERATLLLRFFVPYALILVGSLLVGWFAYHKTSALVESESMETNSAVLGQIRESLDRRFAEIETIAQQMSSESKIQSFQFIRDPFTGTNPYKLWDLEKSLFDYRIFNHFIVDYYIAYKNSGMIISPQKVYRNKQLYDLQFHYDNIPFDEWYKQLFDQYHYKTYLPGATVVYENKTYSVVSYMQSFGSRDSQGVITVLIDNKQIQEMLRHLDVENGGFAYIADQNGKLISQVGGDQSAYNLKALSTKDGFSRLRWKGTDMLITQTTSTYNNWTYVAAQPEAVVLEKAYYIKELTLSVFILALVAGLSAAFFLAYRSSRPFLSMLQLLPVSRSEETGHGRHNTIDYIRNSVTDLIESRDELRERLEKQLPLIRSVFYDRLLKGGFTSGVEIEAAMEHSRIIIRGDIYAAAIIQIRGYHAPFNEAMLTELDIVKLNIYDRLFGTEPNRIQIHDLGENQIALILSSREMESKAFREDMKKLLSSLREGIQGMSDSGITISVGGGQRRLTELYRSFGEARFVLNHASWGGSGPVIFHDDMELSVPAYYYPSDMELRLIQLVKSGNQAETKQLIQLIRDKNRVDRQRSTAVERLLAQELCGTLMKCCEQATAGSSSEADEVETILKASDPALAPATAMDMVFRALLEICRKNEERKKSHNDHLAAQLSAYIQDHYEDADLSLTRLAREANTSEAYVSYFFKEQTGLNFSDYLEDIRMNRAKELLAAGSRPISDIAVSIGYLSLNSFSRAFKRANGISATEYRKLNQAV